MQTEKVCTLIAAMLMGLLSNLANATTYSNTPDGYALQYFGAGDTSTSNYGELFSLTSGGTLNSFSFYTTQGNPGNLDLVIAHWNGSYASGPALYTSPIYAYAGGAQTLSFSGINTLLAAGNYVAYVTVDAADNSGFLSAPASVVIFALSDGNGGLGGNYTYDNSGSTNPLYQTNAWTSCAGCEPGGNLEYSATFNASAVPAPATAWLLASGLGGLGVMRRKRKSN